MRPLLLLPFTIYTNMKRGREVQSNIINQKKHVKRVYDSAQVLPFFDELSDVGASSSEIADILRQ